MSSKSDLLAIFFRMLFTDAGFDADGRNSPNVLQRVPFFLSRYGCADTDIDRKTWNSAYVDASGGLLELVPLNVNRCFKNLI